jgi:penicillin amidase
LAITLKWAGAEPGCAPYLGCLEVGQASDWETFRAAARRWRMPSENLLYADVDDNIGWIAAGLLPVRQSWDGLLPVPGRGGQFEWSGFHPLEDMPQELNPECGFVASANHNIVPPGCRFSIGFDWKAPYRIGRIRQFLQAGSQLTAEDFKRLQTDEYSIQAQELVDRLKGLVPAEDSPAGQALLLLATWDCVLAKDSAAAALFELWLSSLRNLYLRNHVPAAHRQLVDERLRVDTVIRLLDGMPAHLARALLTSALAAAVLEGQRRLGPRMDLWRWGSLHKMRFAPPIGLPPELAADFEPGEFECGGDEETLTSTRGPDYRCNYGPAYRQILDLADWDRSVFVNAPGQSGDPDNRHFNDHTALLLEKDYAPLLYSRAAIARHVAERLILRPAS